MYSIATQAIEYYGEDNQLGIAQEELAELIQAISKYKRNPNGFKECKDVEEEIADVYIMLHQLKEMLNISDTCIDYHIKFKLDRLEQRMEGADHE